MYGYQNLRDLVMNNPLQRVFANKNENFPNIFAGTPMTQYQNPIVFQNNNINFGFNIPHPTMCNLPNTSFMNNGKHVERSQDSPKMPKDEALVEECEEKVIINKLNNVESNSKDTNFKEKERIFDMENYNDYVEMEKKNIITQKIKASKKCYNCTFPGCKKKYSAPYNLKIHYRSHVGERPYKCNYDNCDRAFYDQGNLKYHIRTFHKGERKKYLFKCGHSDCNLHFKTKKQKLNHHNKLEKECFSERNALIKLAARFKNLYHCILKELNLKDVVEKTDNYNSLRKEFENSMKDSFDYSFFVAKLGESFANEEKEVK